MSLLVGCMQIDASIPGKITHYGVVGLNVRRHCRRLAGLEINQELTTAGPRAAGAHASAHFPELLVRCT